MLNGTHVSRLLARSRALSEPDDAPPLSTGTANRETGVGGVAARVRRALRGWANLPLLAILAVSALLRFWDLNWDRNFHLHPDERFLTMVGVAVKMPTSLAQYLNPATSTLNPANANFSFFVYGAFPLILNRVLAALLHTGTYDLFTIQGRVLSGVADLLVVLLVYKIALLLEATYRFDRRLKYLAAGFYAVAVLPIQLAHFYAVDSFLNLFMTASLYFALRHSYRLGVMDTLLSGASFGLALACKVTAFSILPLVGFFLVLPFVGGAAGVSSDDINEWRTARFTRKETGSMVLSALTTVLGFGFTAYLVLRFADPYMFASPNLLNPRISQLFLDNLRQLSGLTQPGVWYPPAVQWFHKPPVVFALINIAFFGLGLPFLMLTVAGMAHAAFRIRGVRLLTIELWVVAFFLYQSVQFAKTMRYFIFLYPLFALFAAIGYTALTKRAGRLVKAMVVVTVLIWPAAFMGMYTETPARIAASYWLYQHAANNSLILSESWDDALPLPVTATYGKQFRSEQLPVFDPDTGSDKWRKMNTMLKRGDYYVLSSNRGWGSIPTVPERYPLMTRFYRELFAGKTRYKQVAVFTSYPTLGYLGIPIQFPDQWSEESFTVYDHPKVMIFQRQP